MIGCKRRLCCTFCARFTMSLSLTTRKTWKSNPASNVVECSLDVGYVGGRCVESEERKGHVANGLHTHIQSEVRQHQHQGDDCCDEKR